MTGSLSSFAAMARELICTYCTLALMAFLLPRIAVAQAEFSAFSATGRAAATTFVTDYQAIGINPANLGQQWRFANKHVAIGLFEGAFSVHSDALTRDDVRNRLLNADFRFTEAQKEETARAFADAGAHAGADVMALGVAWLNTNAGGFAFQVRDRMQMDLRLGPKMADLVFRGYRSDYFDLLVLATGDTVTNYGQLSPDSLAMVVLGVATEPQLVGRIADGTQATFNWYREFNFSYGRHLARSEELEFDVGIGLKYLLGIGIIDIRATNGELSGFSSLSPDFQIDYQQARWRPDAGLTAATMAFPRTVGQGFGLDLGLAALVRQRWKLGLAVTDVGAMHWNGNVYAAHDGSLVDLASSGLDNLDLINGLEDFITNGGVLDWQQAQAQERPLPTTVRLGLGRLLGEKAEVGLDAIFPLNDAPGSLQAPVLGLGGELRPMRWLQLGAGLLAGGGQALRVPTGITFMAGNGTWEAGLATRDITSYFTLRDPTLSVSMGFLRFRF